MPGKRQFLGIGNGSLHLNVAGCGIHLGVDRGDFSLDHLAGKRIGGNTNRKSRLNLPKLLLRQQKIDVNRVQRLQRNDRIPFTQHLPQIDQPDSKAPGERGTNGFFPDDGTQGVAHETRSACTGPLHCHNPAGTSDSVEEDWHSVRN